MVRKIFMSVYCMPLELAIILMLLTVVLWPFTKKLFSKKFVWKCGNLMICICSIFAILVATVLSRSSESVELILTPFYSLSEAKTQPEIYRSIFMNILLFFPLGLTLPFMFPEKWSHKVLVIIAAAFVLAVVIEYVQFHYHLGRAETDVSPQFRVLP